MKKQPPLETMLATASLTNGRDVTKDSNRTNTCRIVVLGSPGVGKTALTVRFMTKRFIGEYCPTLESIYKYCTEIDEEEAILEILDTAGELEDYWKEAYALWADCFIFVYSITDRESFTYVSDLKKQIENSRKSTSTIAVIVGNKCDLCFNRKVPQTEGSQLACEFGHQFYEVSASEGEHVTQIGEIFRGLYRDNKQEKISRQSRQRKPSSSVRFKKAIQKVMGVNKVVGVTKEISSNKQNNNNN